MGSKMAGVFIKVNPSSFSNTKIISAFFGAYNYEIVENAWGDFSAFNGKDVVVERYENGIHLMNGKFSDKIINNDKELIGKLHRFFGNDVEIIAYFEMDSMYIYGFRLLENGETKRYRFGEASSFKEEKDPLDEEIPILNKQLAYREEAGERELWVINKDGTMAGIYSDLSQDLMYAVLEKRFGINLDDTESDDVEFFKIG